MMRIPLLRTLLRTMSIGLPLGLAFSTHAQATEIKVGSKKFTESVILGEILRSGLEADDTSVKHLAELGGTRILWNALLDGNIDAYPEYTGTLQAELLKSSFGSLEEMRKALKPMGIGLSEPLGFNNTYAIGMLRSRADELGIERVSDLRKHPQIKIGWGDEFRRRSDGWPGLKSAYNLPQNLVRGLDHDIGYRALQSGDIDLKDLYSTDAEIQYYDLKILSDDLNYFPRYDAVIVYRLSTANSHPTFERFIGSLAGKIDENSMIAMNRQAKIDKISPAKIASGFLIAKLGFDASREIKMSSELAGPGRKSSRSHSRTLIPCRAVACDCDTLCNPTRHLCREKSRGREADPLERGRHSDRSEHGSTCRLN